jgi:Spy/CpxP family protein refolding chaperone
MRKLMLVLAGLLAAAAPALAQTPKVVAPFPAKVKAFGGSVLLARVEHVLRLRQDLSLTEQQITQLDALRKEEVTRTLERSQALADLESRVRAGLAEKAELQAAMQSRMAAQLPAAAAGERVNSILTAEQRAKLESLPGFRFKGGMLMPRVTPRAKSLRPLLMKELSPGTPKLLPLPLRRRII